MPVNKPCDEYNLALAKWQRIRDCAAGRDTILARGAEYVPNVGGLTPEENKNYRARGSFFNAVSRTAHGLNGAIFQKPPKLNEVSEADKESLFEDMTLDDVDLEGFARRVGYEVVLVSRYGVLVDMPPVVTSTVAGTPVEPPQPFCVGYCAEDIVNWDVTKKDGAEVLSFIVLRESVKAYKNDPFTLEAITQFRELRMVGDQCVVQLWRPDEKDKNKFVPFEAPVVMMRRGEALRFIPFYFIGSRTTSSEIEDPMLADLADVNLAHWRNSVDYEYGMHLTALPTPWVAGLRSAPTPPPNEDPRNSMLPQIKLGPGTVWELDKDGQAGMLEFQGTGLATIKAAMDDKRKQMAALGARLLEEQPAANETAQAVKLRHSGEAATLVSTAQAIERGLTYIVRTMLWWLGTEAKPEDVKAEVEVTKEFLAIKATPGEVQAMLGALQANKVSFETWYEFLRNGGWTRDGVTAEEETKAIEKELAEKPQPEPMPGPEDKDKEPVPGKKKRTVRGPDGQVKYVIEDEDDKAA